MNSDNDWRSILGAVIVLLIFESIAITATVGWGWSSEVKTADYAAWVQAIGSIGAILATGWGVNRSHELAKKLADEQRLEARAQFINSAFQLCGAVLQVAKKIAAAGETVAKYSLDDLERMSVELQALNDAIRRLDISVLKEYQLIYGVMMADQYSRLLIKTIAAVPRIYSPGQKEPHTLYYNAEEAANALHEALKPLYKEATGLEPVDAMA